MYHINSILLILILLITGCKKKENDEIPGVQEETKGAIYAIVAYNGQPVPGAVITTDPESSEGTTDATGSALIKNVPEGIYQVFANVDGFGYGSGAVDVDAGDVSETIIYIVPGAFQGLMVNVVSVNPQNATVGEPVSITAVVNDDEDEDEEIAFEWSTDIDGVISTQGVNNGSLAQIQYTFETAGERFLTVTVTDSDGNTDIDSTWINIAEPPEPVVLQPIEAVGNTLHLNWTQSDEANFNSYRVYREGQFGFSVIESIYDINTTSFVDDEATIGIEYNYRIGLYLGAGTEIMSNTETGIFDSEYIYIGTGLDMLRHDPVSPMVYGLDTDNNSLVFIDTEQGEVVNTIYVGSSPTDMDFSLDNQLLYIANSGSTEIAIVDIAAQALQSSFNVDVGSGSWDGNPNTLAVMENDLLAFSGADSYGYIKLTNIPGGINLFTTGQSYYRPYLVANSDGTKLFVGEYGSGSELFRMDLINGDLVLQESSNDFSIQSPQIFITEDDQYVFCGSRKFLASSLLSILGTFNEPIFAINSDGSRALGETKVFNGFNFTSVQDLPVSTKVSVFSNDGTKAYLFHEQAAKLYKVTVE